jgi:hypothetical protein
VKRLYLETTYLAGRMLGQDDVSAGILSAALAAGATVAIPQVCVMESMALLQNERRRRNELNDRLNHEISKVQRDQSASAREITSAFEEGKLKNDALLNEIQTRLEDALDDLQSFQLIDVDAALIKASLALPLIRHMPDNLILHAVANDARQYTTDTCAFFTRNANDFDASDVRDFLSSASVELLLSSDATLEWLTGNAG